MTKISCSDILLPVGKEARIKATLAFSTLLPFKLKRKTITFLLDGERIGQARTGPGGSATLSYTPSEEKDYHLVASYEASSRSRAATAHATIFSRSTSRQAIVLDLDGTLSSSSTFRAVFRRNRSISPLADAVEVTKALAQKYSLLIVTGRRTYLRRKTKRWLADKGFPQIPIFFSPVVFRPFAHKKFKTRLIRQLKETWPNISIGIGDRDSDATAYLANGLKAIIIRRKGRCPSGAIVLPDWRSIQQTLIG